MTQHPIALFFFFFNDTATTEIYTLSLHDALPIYEAHSHRDKILTKTLDVLNFSPLTSKAERINQMLSEIHEAEIDRKSTRLNSSHDQISYAVFCLKKKKTKGHTCVASLTLTTYLI